MAKQGIQGGWSSKRILQSIFTVFLITSLVLVVLSVYYPNAVFHISYYNVPLPLSTTHERTSFKDDFSSTLLFSTNQYIQETKLRNLPFVAIMSKLMNKSDTPQFCNVTEKQTLDTKTNHITSLYSDESDSSRFCQICEYPERFVLETTERIEQNGSLFLNACTEEFLTIRAVDKNGANVNCQPWVDIHGRIIGPNLKTYPTKTGYSLYFNKVRVMYSGQGKFLLAIPALPVGKYRLEILVVHTEKHRVELFNTRHQVPCLDQPVENLPQSVILKDNEKCKDQIKKTKLCTTGTSPGRWVTIPGSRCDGVHCEGDGNILESSGRVWAPYDCHYKLYGPKELKKCFHGKNVLLIGDSITEELTNEFLQIYNYKSSLMTRPELSRNKSWVGRQYHWKTLDKNGGIIGFNFILARPLGCGLKCVIQLSRSALKKALVPYGKIDHLILLTGPHDVTLRGKIPDDYNVFVRYKTILPAFFAKIKPLLARNGKIVWLNSPEGSDLSRCDFLSKPRTNLINAITEKFLQVQNNPFIKRIDYFDVSESCYCGNIHKGIRFYDGNSNAGLRYNGFVSRMVAHMTLTLLCQ